MRYINSVLGLGIFLIILPALGFPSGWKSFFMIVVGVWLCIMSYSMRTVRATSVKQKKTSKKIHVSTTHLEPIPEIKNEPVYNNPHEPTPTV